MKVSTLIITYNQEEYITSAINSALAQATGFDYEIIVGEDASSDRTRQIVLDFQKEYPDKIRLLLCNAAHSDRERALGIGGKTNFAISLQACKGEYVALLDGDDYWTDVHKLQKQVNFLDTHPDFAICYHNVTVLYEDGSKAPANFLPPNHKGISTLEDLLLVNFIPACSAVFRRGLFGELPDWFFSLRLGDWPIHLMNANCGKIRYFSEVMATFRIHDQGVWSSRSQVSQHLEIIKMLDQVDAYLGFKYKKQIRASKAEWYHQLAEITHREGDRASARTFLGRYCLFSRCRNARKILSLFLRSYLPGLYRGLRTLRNWVRPNGVTTNNPGQVSTTSR